MDYKDCVIKNNSLLKVNKDVTEFVIPNSVTSIGYAAFYNCKSLTSIVMPNSVTSIGKYAFAKCTALTSITIPNSVISIRDFVFSGCYSLTSITIPNSVISIRDFVFSGCYSLTSIIIPRSVTSIREYAFYETHFANIFNKLTVKQFITFVNSKDKFSWIGKYNIELNDIMFLLNKKEYNGFNSGITYGL